MAIGIGHDPGQPRERSGRQRRRRNRQVDADAARPIGAVRARKRVTGSRPEINDERLAPRSAVRAGIAARLAMQGMADATLMKPAPRRTTSFESPAFSDRRSCG